METPTPRPVLPPWFALLLGILAVSTASIFIRYAQAYAPSFVIAAYRLTIASLILLPIAFARRRAELQQISPRELGLALLSGFFLALHFASWITSLEYTSVASSVVFVTTTPLWVALLAPITVKERLTAPILLGLVFALGGGIIVGVSDTCTVSGLGLACPPLQEFIQGKAFLGDLLALAGAWMAAGYLLIGRSLRSRLSLISYISVVYSAAALVLIIIMLAAGQKPFGYPPQAYLWLVLLALVPQLLGHSTFNWALGFLPAAFVSITLLGEPAGSTVLAYFLLNETPGSLKIIGAILILAGIVIASQTRSQSPAD